MTSEELQVIISAHTADLEKKLTKAQKDVGGFSEKGKKAFEAFNKAAATVGKATAAAMKITAGAVAAGAAALTGLAESTRESRAETAKLNAAFEAAGSTAEQASKTYNGLYRVLGDSGQATEAAAHLAKLTTDQENLAEWTNICRGVYATFGDSLPIEGLTEAANETAKVGALTGGLADALNWAGVNEDEFNAKLQACNTEAEREALIRETLNGLYSDAAGAYEETAGSIMSANEAQAELTAGLNALGAAAEPIVTLFKSGLAKALKQITPHFEKITKGFEKMVNGVSGGAEEMKEGITGLVSSILTIVSDMLPSLLTIGVQIITALLEGIVSVFPSVVNTIVTLIPTIIQALITLIPQITAALLNSLPIILEALMQAVTAIVEGLAVMLPQILTQIVNIVPLLIEQLLLNIPILIEAAVTLLMALVEAIPLIIPPLIEALPQIIDTLITVVLESIPLLIDAAIELLMALVDAIPQIIPPLVEALPLIIDNIINTLLENLPLILEAAIRLLMAIIQAIPQIITPLVEALPEIIMSIVSTLLSNLPLIISTAVQLFMGIVKAVPKITMELLKAIGSLMGSCLSSIGGAFIDIGAKIGSALSSGIKTAINWIIEKAVGFINTFIDGINFALKIINAIPSVNIPLVARLDVPQFAKGGIVDSATLGVFGEAGTEAVVPLENNLGWLDKLAGMLDERMSNGLGNAPIVIKVGERTFGEVCVDSINGITAQTGSIPLVMA